MQPNNGFITTQEAIQLIKAHTKEKPTVNLNNLVATRDYIEKAHNYTIRLAEGGVVYAKVVNDADKYSLREEIKQAAKRTTGLDLNLDERPTREVTSIVDPETNPKGRPMIDTSNDPLYAPNRQTRI